MTPDYAFCFRLHDREYGVLKRLDGARAAEILRQTGHVVRWPAGSRELQLDLMLHHEHRSSRELGRGGFGLVAYGMDKTTRRYVCIKLVSGDAGLEAQIHAALKGAPNVVQLLGHHRQRDYCGYQLDCLVMELGGLGSLWDMRGIVDELSDEAFKQDLFFHWSGDMLRGLDAIHRRGIAHLDFNLRNVVIDDRACIVDLGCAQRMGRDGTVRCEGQDGTLDDYSAERWSASSYGWRASGEKIDGWAAGLAFIRFLTGDPFPIDRYGLQQIFELDPASRAAREEKARLYMEAQLARFGELDAPSADSPWSVIRALLVQRLTPAEALALPYYRACEPEARRDATMARMKFLVQSDRLGLSPLRIPLIHPNYIYRAERETVLEHLQRDRVRIAICGATGTGKTTLATEVARVVRGRGETDHVLWFHSGPLEQQFAAAARELEIVDEMAGLPEAFAALERLCQEKSVLLVFDGCEEVEDHLPEGCKTLVTRADPPSSGWHVIELEQLDNSQLLAERLIDDVPEGFCAALDHHPGRIAQACAYMRNCRVDAATCLAEMPRTGETLFGAGYEPALRSVGVGDELLRHIAYLHPDLIERDLIDQLCDDNSALLRLLELDLLRDQGAGRYSMHPELQRVVRRRISDEEPLRRVVQLLCELYDWSPDSAEAYRRNLSVLTHGQRLSMSVEDPASFRILGELRARMARELWKLGLIEQAGDVYHLGADLARRGDDLVLQACCLVDEGRSLLDLGMAEAALEKVREAMRHLTGEDLGEAKTTEAIAQLRMGETAGCREALDEARRLLPAPKQQRVHCAMGDLLRSENRFEEAIGSYTQSFVLGNRAQQLDVLFLQSVSRIGWSQADPRRGPGLRLVAQGQLETLVDEYRRMYGGTHERVAKSLLNLSHVHYLSDQPDAALAAATQCLEIVSTEDSATRRDALYLQSESRRKLGRTAEAAPFSPLTQLGQYLLAALPNWGRR